MSNALGTWWEPGYRGGRLEVLEAAECARLLVTTNIGRLGFSVDDGQRIVPMNFVIADLRPSAPLQDVVPVGRFEGRGQTDQRSGEAAVPSRYIESTRSTSGPSISDAVFAAIQSGSARKSFQAGFRSLGPGTRADTPRCCHPRAVD